MRSAPVDVSQNVAEKPSIAAPEQSLRKEPGSRDGAPRTDRMRWRTLLALPIASVIALAVHLGIAKDEPAAQTSSFTAFLGTVLALSVLAGGLQSVWLAFRRWLEHMNPIFAASVLVLCGWEVVTTGFRWLPMPYFPSPAGVLQSMIDDRKLLFECTWNSLLLLIAGYVIGVIVGVIAGICIGWFREARYWGMPLLKIIGPIPATAWVPLAMVITPNGKMSAIGLVALAVWFPVSMLTISGISNVKASYLDVARTLGAKPSFLIFRVAVPAAMPSIFIGLFMGLGTSFLTLIVAETVGVKAGLGWYVGWAQGWAEYGKVYAALILMAAFFSTIMTLLFKVRDRVLVWQKGVIKW